MGESTEPCGTPFVKCLVGDSLPLYSVYASLPERQIGKPFLEIRVHVIVEDFLDE